MKVIGITGTSGSGKTTIGEILGKRQNTKVINADQMVKQMTNTQTAYFLEIKTAFKKENIILENGMLNRAKLADLIYHNKKDLEKLNEITFKHLIPQILQEIEQVSSNIKMVILDAPLLFEAGLERYCDFTIAIEAPVELKIARICKRDQIPEEVAQNRLKIQKKDEFYFQRADYIIENHEQTTLQELEKQLEIILKMSKGEK